MRRLVPLLAVLTGTPACEQRPQTPVVTVEDAVATLPAMRGRPGAAYFTLRTNQPTRLTGISSPQVGRIELHESVRQGNVSRMVPLGETTLSPDAPLVFAPGGRHAMLLAIDPAVTVGGRLRLTFTFDPAPPVTVEAEGRGPGEAGNRGD